MPANTTRLRLLGAAAWATGDGPWRVLSRKDAALLARLALDGPQPRTAVAEWLWPGVPLPRAHANLRQRLFRLRQAAGALVAEEGDGLHIAAGTAVDLDGDGADFDALLLAGLLAGDDPVQQWLDDARRRWLARRADRMTGLAARHEAAGALAAALALTERLLALEPLLEHAWRRLMRLHLQRGDRAAAVAAFERCEHVLRDELGLRPSPETQALLARVQALAETPAAAPSPLPPSLLRPPQRVGREAEWRTLQAAWLAGPGFVLEAEPGLGRSRLLADFAAEQPRVLLVAAQPGDAGVPYALLLRLLRRLAAQGGDVWPDGVDRRELARLLPELGPPPAAPGQDALLQAALRAVFPRLAAVGWQGVLVDDLHLADAASAAVLCAAAGAPDGLGLRWGLSQRRGGPVVPAALAALATLVPVTLGPLDDAASATLLAGLALPLVDTDGPLAERLVRHCGGHPTFLLETVKHLLLDPASAQRSALPLPPRVESAIGQRLARLSAPAMALLRVAALAGGDSHPELLADVLGQPLLALADAWHEAEAAQLLRDDGLPHEALRETVLAGLPRALHAPLHERVAFALQRRAAPAATLARHFGLAGLHDAAARASRCAADDAWRLGRGPERLQHLADAAAAFTAAGDAAAAFEAQWAAIDTRLAVQGPDAALALVQALRADAVSATQRVDLALAAAQVALAAYRFDVARDEAGRALAEAEAGSGADLRARLIEVAAAALLGDVAQAKLQMPALLPRLQAVQDLALAAHLWSHWAAAQHATGQPQACRDALEQQCLAARAVGDARLEADALASLGGQLLQAGESEVSLQRSGEAAVLLRRLGDAQTARVAEVNQVIALVGHDQLAPALALLDQLAHGPETAVGADILRIVTELRAEAAWRRGDFAAALKHLGEAPDASQPLARRVNHALNRAQALQALGDVQTARDAWEALNGLLAGTQGVGVALRAQALASVVRPAGEALALLTALVARAARANSPPAAGIARLRRLAWAWREGDVATAVDDADWLVAHAPRIRHIYVPGGEWRARVVRLYEAVGRASEARALRTEALRWFHSEVLPQLPPGAEPGWRGHPAYGDLFG